MKADAEFKSKDLVESWAKNDGLQLFACQHLLEC